MTMSDPKTLWPLHNHDVGAGAGPVQMKFEAERVNSLLKMNDDNMMMTMMTS